MQKVLLNIEHHTGIAEVKGSNLVEALTFFSLLPSNCLNWKIYCDDHSSLSSTTAVRYEIHIYFTSFHCTGRYELNKLTLLPMCGLTAQLVEHHTGIVEVTGSNPLETLIFFRLLPSNCLNWKFTLMITLHFHQQPHYNMNFIYMSHSNLSSACFWFNMAEAEQAPCPPPVLVEILA